MASESNDRYAHPQSIETGGVAVVRKGIEDNIESMILTKVVESWERRTKLYAIGVDAGLLQPGANAFPAAGRTAEEKQSGIH